MSQTWHIHIRGQVQGVGFRPFVYKKAQEFELKGWVNNTTDGVHCEFNTKQELAHKFYDELIAEAPSLSCITAHTLAKAAPQSFSEFKIIHSRAEGQANLLLTPDFALCDDCRSELFDESNRRHGYPFITCTNCGPRYSIIQQLPYDRERTTMRAFPMCEPCETEYQDPLDRRYFSQTNSCETCGIVMTLYDDNKKLIWEDADQIISTITQGWSEGKIVALKGIGGYLLTCDAGNKEVIKRLRTQKNRPAKPFALMYADVEMLERDVHISEKENTALTGSVSPITISAVKENPASGICISQIAPGLSRLGVMTAYTPLYALLLEAFGGPIVATSGNITNAPIVYDNEQALLELTTIADFVLTNNREIVVPQDDSVQTFTAVHQQKIIHRRSRGMAPSYINADVGSQMPAKTILATGASLKSTFTYLHHQNIFISQYLGDLDHFDTQQNYRHTVEHFLQLFDEPPEMLLADKHPDYFSTRFSVGLAHELNVPIKKYQHHKAHFAAVLGEHDLLDSDAPILGVIWDGTGLGDDNEIWGGEFFTYHNDEIIRRAHIEYFDFITADKMPREPRISALAATAGIEGTDRILREKFSDLEWKNYQTLLQKSENLQTSSMGRLFDAVSALLGLKDCSSYEGEAAMLLEKEARDYLVIENKVAAYPVELTPNNVSTTAILQSVVDDILEGNAAGLIAARFHRTLVEIIKRMAEELNLHRMAFSGGVFQNALLVDLIIEKLGDDYTLYFHKKLSPNDENISFGQLMCHHIEG